MCILHSPSKTTFKNKIFEKKVTSKRGTNTWPQLFKHLFSQNYESGGEMLPGNEKLHRIVIKDIRYEVVRDQTV